MNDGAWQWSRGVQILLFVERVTCVDNPEMDRCRCAVGPIVNCLTRRRLCSVISTVHFANRLIKLSLF